MSEARVIAAILGAEWAITPEALQGILSIAKRENESPEAVEARIGRPLENTHRAEMRGSVAVIPVVGPLFRRANMFTRVSGATSYDMVAQDLREALDNPAAKSIVLNIDSPGGMANGVAELAGHIYEARAKKPVIAYVGGTGASAAYWLAASASSVVAARTALLGSVGVVVGVGGGKGEDEIVSSQSPYKRVDPKSAEGRARTQAMVDNLAAIFVADVAKYRAATEEQVLAKFGQGDVMLGQQAQDAGMIDKIGTFEGLIAELNAGPTERKTMDKATLKKEHPELFAQIQTEARAAAEVEARDIATAAKEDADKARDEGATAERTRVLGIIGHAEAKGREALALKLAGMASMTVDGAAELLSATPKAVAAVGAGFDAIMQKNNPTVEADASAGGEEAEIAAAAARIAALANAPQKRL
jgi:capsid assembly protease